MQSKATANSDHVNERVVTKQCLAFRPQRGTLAKCTLRFRAFLHAVIQLQHQRQHQQQQKDEQSSSSFSSTPKIEQAKNELITELKLYDLEMRKTSLTSKATLTELDYYEHLSKEKQETIQQTKNEIEQLKQKLAHEQKVRKNREEYESIAKEALKKESSYVQKRKLEELSKDIEELQEKRRKAGQQVETRRKQFQGLMQNIFDLKNSLEEESVKEEIESNIQKDRDGKGKINDQNDDQDGDLYGDL